MKIAVGVFLAVFVFNDALAAQNSGVMRVSSIVSRDSGSHAIFFQPESYNGPYAVPDQGCALSDRAVIVEQTAGGGTMLQVILSALTNSKRVLIQVDGCTPLDPATPLVTAPKVTKVQIYS